MRLAVFLVLLAAMGIARGQSLGEVFLAPEGDAPGGPEALAYDGRHIWIARPFADAVVRISASSGAQAGSFNVERPGALLHALGAVWVTSTRANKVVKLNPWDGKVLGSYPVGHQPAAMVSDGEHLWVANSGSNSVTKLDRNGKVLLVAAVQARPLALAFDGENIWVANNKARSVIKLRAKDGARLGVFPAGDGPSALAFDGENLWVANYFATRHELERYKCVNNLTVTMLVSSQNADFLEYQIRTARRDIRTSQELLEKQPPHSDTYKTLANHLDEQRANLDKLQRTQNDAEKKGGDAFGKLQEVQQSQSPCK